MSVIKQPQKIKINSKQKDKAWLVAGNIVTFVLPIILLLVIIGLFFGQKKKTSPELVLYNWQDYIAPEVLEGFTKKYGTKVIVREFSDEYEMYDELRNNPTTDKYDLIVVSDSLLSKMADLGVLASVDKRNIPNLKNVKKDFLNNKYNKDNLVAVPYSWATTGLMINTKYIDPSVRSWSVLWDERYKDKVCVLNDPTELVGMAAKHLSLPFVPQSVDQMKLVENSLLEQKKIAKNYCNDTEIRDGLISDKIWAAQIYSSDAAVAMSRNDNLRYIAPKEGAGIWYDNFIIPKNSKNKYTAELFLNYLNDPKVAARNSNYLFIASCNEKAEKYIDDKILKNEIVYPMPATLSNLTLESELAENFDIEKMKRELFNKLNAK